MNRSVDKMFRNALTVQIVSVIVGVIGMVVDGAVTGRCLGTDAMAAFGLVTPVATVFAACASVCGIGTSLLVGRYVGARKKDEASRALSTCLLFAFALSLVLLAAVSAFPRRIASALGAEGVICDMASDYLRGFCLCAPAMLLMTSFMPVMQMDGKGSLMMTAVTVMTAVNVTGDLLVGLVIHGGLLGMSLATSVSYFAALAIMLPHFLSGKSSLRISPRLAGRGYIGRMLKGGFPNALQQACRSLLIISLNSLLLRISGSTAVAAFTAIMSAANLCMALGSGIGASTSMLTGVFAGEKDDMAIRALVRTALKDAVIYDALLCAVLFAGAGLIMPVFTSDPAVVPFAVLGFRLYALSMIGYSVNVTLRFYYQAMHFTVLPYAYVVCNGLVFTVLSALALGGLFGVNGVWLSFLAGETLTLAALLIYVLIKSKKSGDLIERLMFIPDSMAADVLDRYDGAASEVSGVTAVSEEVRRFCTGRGAKERTAYVIALAVEELGVSMLSGNPPGSDTLEVRLLHRKDCWTLRLRDSGKRFNPLTVLDTERPDDFTYVGVKMLTEMITGIEYVDTLNINNLNMEISD